MLFNQSHLNNLRLYVIIFGILWVGCFGGAVAWTAVWSNHALKTLQVGSAHKAQAGVSVLQILTLSIPHDLDIAHTLLEILTTTALLNQEVNSLQTELVGQTSWDVQKIATHTKSLEEQLSKLQSQLKRTDSVMASIFSPSLIRPLATQTTAKKYIEKLPKSIELLSLAHSFLTTPSEYVVLLQNADELRATGGFIGSYVRISNDGKHISISKIQDIYEPAGQFQGFVQAPPGAYEYLSEGKGLKLQDTNWFADFPQTAQTTLRFFSFGDEQALSGVVAINSSLLISILELTGPIYLPDFNEYATASNFAQLARIDRDAFFPGSKQKTIFLNHFLTQLKLQFAHGVKQNKSGVLPFLDKMLTNKYVLMYHEQPELQKKIQEAGLSGALAITPQTALYLYPVESNVGINKANQAVSRTFNLTTNEATSTLNITITNENKVSVAKQTANPAVTGADHLHYVNYQRLLLNPEAEITAIYLDGTKIEQWDDELISISEQNQQLRQIGFLSTIIEETSSTITIEFSHPPLDPDKFVRIIKQPGVPSSTFTFSSTLPGHEQTRSFILDTDTTIQLDV